MIENKGCCSFELAKKIKELGVAQKSVWSWMRLSHESLNHLKLSEYTDFDNAYTVSAWTVAELGELLPNYIEYSKGINFFHAKDRKHQDCTCAKTEADSRAKMLIYLIENNLVKVEDLNKLLEN
jgi:hypothetical protein